MNNKKPFLFWLISGLLILFTGLIAFASLDEWYKVSVLRNIAGYPFGGEGPTPYYYKTPGLYAAVSLTWGLLFSGALIFAVVTTIKRSKIGVITTLGTTILLFITMIANGMIE